MFRHVLVRASEYPWLDSGQAWPGFLSPREEAILAGMEFLPRRRKWLLGRAAAKRLVRAMSGPQPVAETGISVLNRSSGEPFVLVEGRGEWEFPISVSHRSEVGLAAAPEDRGARIGADIETVEPRDPALVRQFFTSGEAELAASSGEAGDEVVARIWSAKEAVLKLLGLGLRLDTRGIVVDLRGEPFLECPAGWRPLAVKVCVEAPAPPVPGLLRVLWRREANHVLTVAVAG
jgi:4'-phosphopantetheinyl transferase